MKTHIGKITYKGAEMPRERIQGTAIESPALDELWKRVRARMGK